jgi:hypothetical protein
LLGRYARDRLYTRDLSNSIRCRRPHEHW